MKRGWGAAILVGMLMLGACGDDRIPDYRYRMTVEVETPEGVKSGSSVIEVRTEEIDTILDSSGKTIKTEISGEAVAVDVAPGQTLFALLSKPDNPDYAESVAGRAITPAYPERLPNDGPFDSYARFRQALVKTTGVHELPREHWPFMVRFRDIDDAKSVVEVKPGDLSDSFGPGIRMKRVIIELTDGDVTSGIEERLPWLEGLHGSYLDGASTTRTAPLGLHEGYFRAGDEL